MKPYWNFMAALVAGAAMNVAAVQSTYAQAKPAYVIVEIRNVSDPAGYKEGSEKAPAVVAAAVAAAGGRVLVATNAIVSLDGKAPERIVLIAFDSAAQAKAWYNSPAMQEINAKRIGSTDSLSFIVEGPE